MSLLREHPLSVITEATERSDSDWHFSHHEPAESVPEYSQFIGNVDPALLLPHGSIFSSETSYGEIVPPAQSAFRSLGASIPSMFDKSLPSLPRSSIAKTGSARSALQTESARGSAAKSESSRHSAIKSQSSMRFASEPESSRRNSIIRLSNHSFPKPDFTNGSTASDHTPFIPPSPPSKPLSSKSRTASPRTASPVATATNYSSSSSSLSTASHPALSHTTLRTLDGVIDEATTSLALRTKLQAETIGTSDNTKVGVCSTMFHADNEGFIRVLANKIHDAMALQSSYLFALIPNGVGGPLKVPTTLAFCGAPQLLVTKASILAGLRFKTRLAELQDTTGTWVGYLEPPPVGIDHFIPPAHDEDMLWDIVRKAVNPIDPVAPPPGSRGIDQLLSEARARIDRLTPREAFEDSYGDGILVDIRSEAQRIEHGSIPRAVVVERNVLEWRFDPRSLDGRLPIADRYDLRVIVFCQVSAFSCFISPMT